MSVSRGCIYAAPSPSHQTTRNGRTAPTCIDKFSVRTPYVQLLNTCLIQCVAHAPRSGNKIQSSTYRSIIKALRALARTRSRSCKCSVFNPGQGMNYSTYRPNTHADTEDRSLPVTSHLMGYGRFVCVSVCAANTRV